MRLLQGEKRPIDGLVFGPDGTRLAACAGRYIPGDVWDVRTGGRLGGWTGGHVTPTDNVRFHPSGRWLYVADWWDGLAVVDTHTWEVDRIEVPGDADCLGVAPTGDRMVVGSTDTITAFAVAVDRPRVREWQARCELTVRSIAFIPDGGRFVTAEFWTLRPRVTQTLLRVRSAASGEVLNNIGCDCATPQQVVVSADGSWIALRAAGSLLAFHQTDPAWSVKLQIPNRRHLTGIAFHPSGRFLAATSNDATVRLFDTKTWTVTRSFDWSIGRLRSVAFSPDGTTAAAGGDFGKVVVWDVDL